MSIEERWLRWRTITSCVQPGAPPLPLPRTLVLWNTPLPELVYQGA